MHVRRATKLFVGLSVALAACRSVLGIDALDEGTDDAGSSMDAAGPSIDASPNDGAAAETGGDDGGREADLEWSRWGVPPGSPSTFTAQGEVVVDSLTGLTWQRGTMASAATWSAAQASCTGLSLGGVSDWRLPTRIELASIIDYQRAAPVLAPSYFDSTVLGVYWTASTFAADTTRAWGADMTTGGFLDYAKTNSQFVKCVRGGTEAVP